MKRCKKCGEWKTKDKFYKDKTTKDRLRGSCISCLKIAHRIYCDTHKEEEQAYQKKHLITHRAERNATLRKYYLKNKKKINKDSIEWMKAHPEKTKACSDKYRAAHREELLARNKEWAKNNPEKIRALWRKSSAKKQKEHKLSCNMSKALCKALKGNKNGQHWERLVGYTADELREHLQKQFVDGMNWANYGRNGWEVDHVIPKSAYNYSDASHVDFQRCWSLNNLQPMWAHDNNSKGNKLTESFQPSLALSAEGL